MDIVLWVLIALMVVPTLAWVALPISLSWSAWMGFVAGATVTGWLSHGHIPTLLLVGLIGAWIGNKASVLRLAGRLATASNPKRDMTRLMKGAGASTTLGEALIHLTAYPKTLRVHDVIIESELRTRPIVDQLSASGGEQVVLANSSMTQRHLDTVLHEQQLFGEYFQHLLADDEAPTKLMFAAAHAGRLEELRVRLATLAREATGTN